MLLTTFLLLISSFQGINGLYTSSNTEVTLSEDFVLSTPCTSNFDCVEEDSTCSRFYKRCLIFKPPTPIEPQQIRHTMNPAVQNISSVDDVVEFGRLIEEYTRGANCLTPDIFGWNCTVCNGTFTSGFSTAVVASSSWDTLAFAGFNLYTEMIIVSFRGTKGIPDSILDALVFQIEPTDITGCEGCLVEEGFHFAHRTIADPLFDVIEHLINVYPTFRVLVTGHSLGGGLASIHAVNLATLFNITPELYTFAQVRVGNQKYIDFLEEKIVGRYRYVHKRDLVPHLPLEFMNFFQHGPEVWQQLDGTYTICHDGEDKLCSNSNLIRVPSDHCTYLDLPICHCDWIYVTPDIQVQTE